MVLEKKSEERKKVSPAKKKIYSHLSLFFPGPSMFYVTLLRVDSIVVHLSYLLSLVCPASLAVSYDVIRHRQHGKALQTSNFVALHRVACNYVCISPPPTLLVLILSLRHSHLGRTSSSRICEKSDERNRTCHIFFALTLFLPTFFSGGRVSSIDISVVTAYDGVCEVSVCVCT